MTSIPCLSSSSSSSSFSSQFPTTAALADCIARVESLVEQGIMDIRTNDLREFDCSITGEFPKNPVVANCEHVFDRAAIERWRDINIHNGRPASCPLCKKNLTQFTGIIGFRNLADRLVAQDSVLTNSHFESSDESYAEEFLAMALKCINRNDHKGALVCFTQAFRYTNSSVNYTAVPLHYERLGEAEKVKVSRLHLSSLQLKEGKIKEALETLKNCESKILDVSSLIIGLTLQLDPSAENIAESLAAASAQEDSDAKVFIYKQILAHAPDSMEAYEKLIPLIKDPKMKQELRLKAADLAQKLGWPFDLELSFQLQAETPLVSIVISKEDWRCPSALLAKIPPKPQALLDFLAEDCTIWPGQTRDKTHIVVPLCPEVFIDGDSVPLTLERLGQLDKSSGGFGYKYIWDKIPKNKPAEKEFHWAVLTKDVLPGSRNKSYDEQVRVLPPGYEVPGVLDAARAILWENRCSGARCFNNDNLWTYTRCKEEIEGYYLVVGGFAPSGLYVTHYYYDNSFIGVAGWRKF